MLAFGCEHTVLSHTNFWLWLFEHTCNIVFVERIVGVDAVERIRRKSDNDIVKNWKIDCYHVQEAPTCKKWKNRMSERIKQSEMKQNDDTKYKCKRWPRQRRRRRRRWRRPNKVTKNNTIYACIIFICLLGILFAHEMHAGSDDIICK